MKKTKEHSEQNWNKVLGRLEEAAGNQALHF
jgi:hypothetical protein